MAKELDEDLMWSLVGFIKVSPSRYKTLKILAYTFMMPAEISRDTGLRTAQVSNALHDLKDKNLVRCLNESASKGRLYRNTDLGNEILKIIDENIL